MLGFITLRGCKSIGADNTICLAFLFSSLAIYGTLYALGLALDHLFGTDMLIRILLTSAYSVRYLIKLPREVKDMELGAQRLEQLIDETF